MSAPFDPVKLLDVLCKHNVRYVVIGGFAATAYGSHLPTTDIDITPERSRETLTQLSSALRKLEARVRTDGVPDGLAFAHDARSLRTVGVLNLVTKYGDLDLVMEPAGGATFGDLASRAVVVQVQGVTIPLAALDDVIASKRAANRPKDRAAFATLELLRQRVAEEADSLASERSEANQV